MFQDPESFLDGHKGRRIVLDEVHRLRNPSEILKIAADHYPSVKVLATGSSSLGASRKFRDTLAGRKRELLLTPMNSIDLVDFSGDLNVRFLHGGLPPFFLQNSLDEHAFQEWMDAFWAKDIQELFRLERRSSFLRFVELMIAQSGGIFEATRFSRECEVSRTTISNYLAILESTFVAHILRPFSTRKSTEIVAAPKVYAFDTGFVCYYKGWSTLRQDDFGLLWEHYVLNELHSYIFNRRDIRYWRDKAGHEVDIVLVRRGAPPKAMEIQWSDQGYDPKNLRSFRSRYIHGDNLVVCSNITRGYTRKYGSLHIRFCSLREMIHTITKSQL